MKWDFLENLGANAIKNVFMTEINGDMLGKFLILFENKLNDLIENESQMEQSIIVNYLNLIFDLLKCLTRCNRFKLNLMFLKDSELNAFKKIISVFEENSNVQLKKFIFYEFSQESIEYLKSNYL